jgi:hypothetical protein
MKKSQSFDNEDLQGDKFEINLIVKLSILKTLSR